jgi:hypothetical protein
MSRPRPAKTSGSISWIALGMLCGCIDVEGLEFDLMAGGAPIGGATNTSTGNGAGGAGPRTYFDVVMEDEPLAYFRVGEEQGTAGALDSSGNGQDAVYYADTGSWTLGVEGALTGDADTAVTLSNGAYIVLTAHSLNFSGHRPYSLEAWVRHDSGTTAGEMWRTENELGQGFVTFFYPDEIFHKRHDESAGTEEIHQDQTPLTDALHHVVVTFDGEVGQLYIDGAQVLARAEDFNFELPLINDGILIAETGAASTLTFDELAIYDEALSLQRVEAHYRCGNENNCE